MAPLSLALFVHDLDVQVGGMERQAAQLAAQFVARGHRVRALTWPRGGADLPARETREGVEILRFVSRPGMPSAVTAEVMTLEMAAALQRDPPDLLYAIHYRGAVHASAFRDLFGIPLVVKLACSGYFGDFQTATRRGDQAGIGALLGADSLVCLNQEVEAEALAAGASPSQLERIRNGVEVERFAEATPASREALGLATDDRPLLFVGRLARQKRLGVLLDALAGALTHVPQLVLLIAGEGPEREALVARAAELGISERVRWLGARSDVAALLRRAEAFVLPSCSEGISNALLEALAAGTPAIVSRIPGNVEVVGDSAGLLVELDDAASLEAGILETLREPTRRAERVAAGYSRLEEEFSFEAVTSAYERLFHRLLETPPERSRRMFLRRGTRATIPYAFERASFRARYALGQVRARVSDVVVGLKRGLGVEGGGRGERSGSERE